MSGGQEPEGELVPVDEVVTGEVVAESVGPDAGAADIGAALGGLDMGAMLQMAQDMGQRMQEAQEELADTLVEGSAGGGVVTVTLNGHLHLVGIRIEPAAIDPDDLTMLQDLVLAAWTDASDRVSQLQAQADPLGGLGGMGGLGGLLGG